MNKQDTSANGGTKHPIANPMTRQTLLQRWDGTVLRREITGHHRAQTQIVARCDHACQHVAVLHDENDVVPAWPSLL